MNLKSLQPLLYLLCALLSAAAANAQGTSRSAISSGGTVANTDGLIIQQTVGQPYATHGATNDSFSLRPGFIQPIEMKIEPVISSISLSLYPNPATESVTVESSTEIDGAFLSVVDLEGRLIWSEQITGGKSAKIICASWPSGSYIISVRSGNSDIYSSKLIITK